MTTQTETEMRVEGVKEKTPDIISGGLKSEDLRNLVDRIERLEEEKKGIAEDVKMVYTEAKSAGFNPKTMKEIIKMRKKDAREVEEEEILLELYKSALGM